MPPDVDWLAAPLALGTLYAEAADDFDTVGDAFVELGGRWVDTAAAYGDGFAERIVGGWIEKRSIRNEVLVIGKGAHPPHCHPDGLLRDAHMSVARLRIGHIDLYMPHRDNPAVPVGEFVGAMNDLMRGGVVHAFGVSNWSRPRIDEANAWAAAHGMHGIVAVSNQLSLARPKVEIWPGSESAGTPDWRDWLRRTQMPLVAWSSQAEGFFAADAEARERVTGSHGMQTWWTSENLERRRRATVVASRHGVEATNVALRWVVEQQFPAIAVIGPESTAEVASAFRALRFPVGERELEWIDLGG